MTIFTVIEAIINNRPLTYVSDNPDESHLEPLTPNNLLLGRYKGDSVIKENHGDISSLRIWKQVNRDIKSNLEKAADQTPSDVTVKR